MGALLIDNGLSPVEISNGNDFKADLNGLGLDMVFDDGGDVLVTGEGTVVFRYHGAESSFRDQFLINGVVNGPELDPGTVLKTENNESFLFPGEVIGQIEVQAGQRFSELGIGFRVRNGDENQQDALAGTSGFGIFFTGEQQPEPNVLAVQQGYEFLVFGFDDNLALDDDHDDMIVSATFIPVPEPGSLALLGLGATCVMGRRRRG